MMRNTIRRIYDTRVGILIILNMEKIRKEMIAICAPEMAKR